MNYTGTYLTEHLADLQHDNAQYFLKTRCFTPRPRWQQVRFHREAKQLTGLQACQCRLARSQRHHIALALRTWTCLKRLANQAKSTAYRLKQRLLDEYMRREVTQPTLRFA